jgi:4-hydroxybenzoate polyprenyltransferase
MFMSSKKPHFLDYLFVLRPILLVPAWTMLLVGNYQAQRLAGVIRPAWTLPGKLWANLALYSALMGAVYIVNQVFDVETDRLNKKLFLVAEGYVSRRAIIVEAVLLIAAALAASAAYFSGIHLTFILLSAMLGLLYSVPPFKFKARPFLDMLANGLGYGLLAFATGWLGTGGYSQQLWLASLPYVLAVSAVYLNTTIPDYASDKATGNVTTGVFLGGRNTIWLAMVLMSLSLGASIYLNDRLCLVASGCALPLFIMAAYTQKLRWTMLAYQAGSLVLVMLTGLIYPVYFVMLLVTYMALRYYHKWRFKMDYPKFADRA